MLAQVGMPLWALNCKIRQQQLLSSSVSPNPTSILDRNQAPDNRHGPDKHKASYTHLDQEAQGGRCPLQRAGGLEEVQREAVHAGRRGCTEAIALLRAENTTLKHSGVRAKAALKRHASSCGKAGHLGGMLAHCPNVPANHLQPSLSRSSIPAGAHLLQACASTLHQPRSSRLQQVVQMGLPRKLARHLRLRVLQRTARRHKAIAAGLRGGRERWPMQMSAMKAPTMSVPAESCGLTSHFAAAIKCSLFDS